MYQKIHDLTVCIQIEGRGKPVILLHGWGANHSNWHPVTEILKKYYKVFVLDLPGFGDSDLPPKNWSLSDYSDFLVKFIEKNKLNKVALLGHSFGGQIAIKTASKKIPMLEKLILTDSAGIRSPKSLKILGILWAAKIGNAAFSLPRLRNLKEITHKKLYSAIGEHEYENSGDLQEIFKRIIREDSRQDLAKVEVPTLIVWGEKDKATPLTHGKMINKLIKKSEIITFPDDGHFAYLEHTEQFCKEVIRFIS